MRSLKLCGWAAAIGLVVAPAASAHDDDCNDQCRATCAATSGALGTARPAKQVGRVAHRVKTPRVLPTRIDENLDPKLPTSTTDYLSFENLQAEERARTAEQFSAEAARREEEHAAELEQIRAEERSAADARMKEKVAQVREEERARAARELEAERNDGAIASAVLTPVGLYGFVGGGATSFTQPAAVGTSTVGGYWDARLGIGTRSVLGAEVSYVGGTRDIQALGLDEQAFLVNNGVEGIARLNVPISSKDMPLLLEPYTFAGLGWSRFNLVNAGNNTSSVDDVDDIMTVPVGVGLQFGAFGATLDVRGTYRQAIGSDLIGTPTSSFAATSLNSWGAGAALGFEF